MSAQTALETLRSLSDPQRAVHALRYFKCGPGEYGEGDRFYGIRVPEVRKVAGSFAKLSLDEIKELLLCEYHEARLLALLILVKRFEKSDDTTRKAIYEFYLEHTDRINNWDLVDSSAPQIVGGYLFDRDRNILYSLVKSQSLWERRIAIMATFYFIRKKQYDDTFSIAEQLLGDTHDLIHKAAGWMLREVGNLERDEEERFLKQHYKTMPRTMLRYAIEKFPENIRQDYLKGRV